MTLEQSPEQEQGFQITSKIKNKVINLQIDTREEEGFGVSQTWDAKDYDKLLDIMADIRSGKKELVTQLVNDAVDIYHGVPTKGSIHSILRTVPKSASIDHNVITHQGIALTNKNITGEDATRFLYIMSGTGNTETPYYPFRSCGR